MTICLPQLSQCLLPYLPHNNGPYLQSVGQNKPFLLRLAFLGCVWSQNRTKDKQYTNQTRTASVGWGKGLRMGHTCFYLMKYHIVGDGVTSLDVCIHQYSKRCIFNNCILCRSLKIPEELLFILEV